MKLIIDIDEEIYNEIKSIVRKPESLYPLDVAIRNGTPIKDGDLISRSALKEKVDTFCEIGTPCSFKSQSACKKCFVTDFRNEINNAPTIE